jgi:hypothetical protein
MRAVAYGVLLTVLTLLAGSLALKALNKGKQSTWEHKIAIVLPGIFIALTPLTMVWEKGDAWLYAERTPALILFESFAVAQLLLSIAMSKTMSLARETKSSTAADISNVG